MDGLYPSPDVHAESRRRRRHAVPISRRRAVYDWTTIALLLAPSLIGIYLFGAVRIWSIGSLLLFSYTGLFLFFLRAFFDEDLRRLQIPPGGVLWLVFLLYAAGLIPVSAVPYEARIEVLKLGSYVGAYWAWTELASRHGRWRVLLGLAIFAVTLIAWYAIIQQAHGSRMVLTLERPDVYGDRASGTYICPNHFAHLMELLIPVCFALMVTRVAGVPLRLLSGYGLVLMLPVMYLTQSRSGWIGTAAGLSVTACLLSWRAGGKRFLIAMVLAPLTVAVVGVLLWMLSDMFRIRVEDALHGNIRLHIWKDTLAMIAAHPVLGWGPGSYQWVFPRFRTLSEQMLFNYAHNETLHLVADYGFVGLVLVAAFMGRGVYVLLRALRKTERDRDAVLIAALGGSMVASLLHSLFDFNFHIFSNNHMLILLAGIACACLYGSGCLKARPVSAPLGVVLYGGGAIACVLLGLASAQVLASYSLHRAGESARTKYEMPEAMRMFRRAADIDPGNWRPYLGLAHSLQSQSFWNFDPEQKKAQAQQAVAFYTNAIARNPYDLEAVFGISKAWNTLGEPERALQYLKQAAEQDREHVFYVSQYGLQLRRMGRDEEALAVFQQAAAKWTNEILSINIRTLQDRIAEKRGTSSTP